MLQKANQQFGPVGFCSTANCSDEIKIWPNSSCTTRVLRNSDSLVQEIELIFLISVKFVNASILFAFLSSGFSRFLQNFSANVGLMFKKRSEYIKGTSEIGTILTMFLLSNS